MDIEPESEIPSREQHEPWIYAHSSSERENISIDYEKVGKWLLFFNNVRRSHVTGLTQHDHAWQFIKKLVENDILYNAKCSTALQGICEAYDKRQNGVICCYTPDYTNKQDVKRAADAIRREVHCPSNLFYKTDNDTRAGKYKHKGDNHVCIYKHTPKGELYERDPVFKKRWNLVNV
ncbi:hypothetical protein AVEN_61843-1 [Araneus ventricosus]|uniref:Uncharacterized protein n=1 Tax=Araneus ventricosus TaxID=182803 RepID=A0A4Y2QYS0_ARAVE|nr:hypothetical protein AVEN_61843-1 [Araneus ventricosus]